MRLGTAVGETLKNLRVERGLTLRKASANNYVSIGHLSEIERDLKEPSFSTLESIARGLDMTTAELILEIYQYLEENRDD